MAEQVKCDVLQILSQTEVVLNAGRENGVQMGMVFQIIGEFEVKDPVSDEAIETLRFTKATLKITHLGDKVSVAGSYLNVDDDIGKKIRDGTFFTPPQPFETMTTTTNTKWSKTVREGDIALQKQ